MIQGEEKAKKMMRVVHDGRREGRTEGLLVGDFLVKDLDLLAYGSDQVQRTSLSGLSCRIIASSCMMPLPMPKTHFKIQCSRR